MATLNTVNKSPYASQTLMQCVSRLGEGAGLLLIEDAVVASVNNDIAGLAWPDIVRDHEVFVLEPDLLARGFTTDQLATGIGVVDYAGFVELAARFDRVHSWF